MLTLTNVLPCDNKRLLGGLESILGLFPIPCDNATSTAQRHKPPQTTSTQATAGHTLGQHWAQLGSCHQANGFTYIALVCRLKKALQYKQPALCIIPDQIYMFI